jgi:carbamoyltransferase
MIILGIQKDHNSSACLYVDEELVYYNQEERLSRQKKDSGLPIKTLQEICKISHKIDVLLISGYDSIFTENLSIINIIKKLGFNLNDNFKFIPYYKSHHLFHAAKAFYDSNFDTALVVVYDGKGSSYNLSNGYQANETTSIFSISHPYKFELVYRRFFTKSNIDSSTKIIWDNSLGLSKIPQPTYLTNNMDIELRNDFDVGFMYEGTSYSLKFDDEGGKMMSLQSFGKFDDTLPSALDDNLKFNMDVFRFDDLGRHRGFDFLRYPDLQSDEKKVNFSFDVQKSFEKIGLNLIKKYLERTGHTNLVITGGSALNVVANYRYRKNLSESIKMFIEPICGDEGNCLGICDHYIRQNIKEFKHRSPMSIYIGGNFPVYNYNLLDRETEISNATPELAAEFIRAGHVVAIFQGKSEAGPRALGNRSILFDPRIKNGKDIVNSIKKREQFRPFAASIMLKYAAEWFDLSFMDESPYMMYAVDTMESKKHLIPSVLHIDGTCRIQTVTDEQNPILFKILYHFNEKTGVPLVLNTSFNLADEPIVETVDNAIDSLRRSLIQYLYLPDINKIIYIPN